MLFFFFFSTTDFDYINKVMISKRLTLDQDIKVNIQWYSFQSLSILLFLVFACSNTGFD